MYVFKDKTENTIRNYCEMCFCFFSFFFSSLLRHLIQNTSTGCQSTRSALQNLRGYASQLLWGVTLRHDVYLSSHYRVISGDVKCDGACRICTCSLAEKKQTQTIRFYCGRKGRYVVIVAVVLMYTIYNRCCAGSAFCFKDEH